MSQKKSSNTRWFGRVKSYEPGNGYGFIECAEAYEEFGRDVYLNGHELRKLDIKTIPVGAEIVFQLDVREGQPRATNLVLPSPKQCECMLFEYTEVLCKLSELLRLHDSTQVSYNALREAEDMLQCKECRRDESTEGAKVLLLLSEARQRWADENHPCHEALREGLLKRLSKPPAQAVEMSIDRVRFTQQNHSKRFLHGPHEGQRIEWLTGQLLSGKIPFSDPSMVLNVVYYHGAYRSLNNRHLTAIVQYAHAVETQNRVPKKCYVRVWPLLRGLLMDDGSNQEIIRKFLRANDSASDGTSIDCKRRIGRSTQVSQDVQIHVSNLDRTVQEPQLMEHLLKAGAEPLRVSIARRSSGRSKGESNCYGWVTFKDAECAEEFLQMPIPPLEGRELKLRLDNVSAIKQLNPGPGVPESGWVRCRGCYQACEPLLDVLLVEGVRLRRDNVPPEMFDPLPTFFCVGPEKSLRNARVISPHPDAHGTSFKLAQVLCKTCGADLGNVQKGSEMQGGVVDLLGERVLHLKCASVLLELSDRQDLLLEVRKWQYLAQVTGRESIYKLSHLTMQEATEKLGLNLNSKVSDRNTNRHARVIPNQRLEAESLEVKDTDVTLAGYPPANE